MRGFQRTSTWVRVSVRGRGLASLPGGQPIRRRKRPENGRYAMLVTVGDEGFLDEASFVIAHSVGQPVLLPLLLVRVIVMEIISPSTRPAVPASQEILPRLQVIRTDHPVHDLQDEKEVPVSGQVFDPKVRVVGQLVLVKRRRPTVPSAKSVAIFAKASHRRIAVAFLDGLSEKHAARADSAELSPGILIDKVRKRRSIIGYDLVGEITADHVVGRDAFVRVGFVGRQDKALREFLCQNRGEPDQTQSGQNQGSHAGSVLVFACDITISEDKSQGLKNFSFAQSSYIMGAALRGSFCFLWKGKNSSKN